MAYNELTLENYKTVITAEILNHFQTGIKNAHDMIEGFRIEYVGRTTDTEGRVVDQYKVIVPSGEEYSFNVTGGKDGAPGAKGEQGLPGNITLNGAELKFFVGKKADYDNLPSKENVFAIITDDPTQIGLMDTIYELVEWINQKRVYTVNLDPYITLQNQNGVELVDFPNGKSISNVVGITIDLGISFYPLGTDAPNYFKTISLVLSGGVEWTDDTTAHFSLSGVEPSSWYQEHTNGVIETVQSMISLEAELYCEENKLKFKLIKSTTSFYFDGKFYLGTVNEYGNSKAYLVKLKKLTYWLA